MSISKRLILAIVILALSVEALHSQSFIIPVEGTYGNDYYIFNYFDWGNGKVLKDCNCGERTYNGHSGTDFGILDFEMMDKGVNVLATDSGEVVLAKDGMFDRETN